MEWSTSRRRHHKTPPKTLAVGVLLVHVGAPGARRRDAAPGPQCLCGFPRLRHFFGPLRCYRFRHLLLLLAPPAAPGIWRRRGQARHQEQPLHLAVCCGRGAAISLLVRSRTGVWCSVVPRALLPRKATAFAAFLLWSFEMLVCHYTLARRASEFKGFWGGPCAINVLVFAICVTPTTARRQRAIH